MITDAQIKEKWIEITRSPKFRNGDVVSTVKMAIALVRWAEEQYKQPAMSMDLPEKCDCGKPFDATRECGFCGAHARY